MKKKIILNSIQGHHGKQGPKGEPGKSGKDGQTGFNGTDVIFSLLIFIILKNILIKIFLLLLIGRTRYSRSGWTSRSTWFSCKSNVV